MKKYFENFQTLLNLIKILLDSDPFLKPTHPKVEKFIPMHYMNPIYKHLKSVKEMVLTGLIAS